MARIALTTEELRGASTNQFFVTFDEIAKNMDQIPEAIENIGNQLSAVATTMENTDNELANALKGNG